MCSYWFVSLLPCHFLLKMKHAVIINGKLIMVNMLQCYFFPNAIPFTFGRKFLPQLDHMVLKIHSIFTAVSVFPQSIHYIYIYIYMHQSQEDNLFILKQCMWILKREQNRFWILYMKLTALYISLHKTQRATTSVVCQHHWLNESRPNSCQTLCYTAQNQALSLLK